MSNYPKILRFSDDQVMKINSVEEEREVLGKMLGFMMKTMGLSYLTVGGEEVPLILQTMGA